MEMDENQTSNKGNNINGKIDSNRTNFGDEEAEDGEIKRKKGNGGLIGCGAGGGGGAIDFTGGGVGRLCGWPSSRIVRVSRASGGKDRHSKVLTSKGLRDRRVRLSVNTAIQFYDLQDRLGYDQPSKAVDWLLKAASNSISELPPISTPFPGTPKQQQLSDTEKRSSGGGGRGGGGGGKDDIEMEGGGGGGEGEPHEGKLSKSGGSSNSETSKGSGGGLSRSESRLKARERARERAAKERESENMAFDVVQQQQKHHRNISSMPQNATFTELLSSGFAGTNTNAVNHHSNNNSPNGSGGGGGGGGIHESNFFQKPSNNWSATPMDYFGGTGLLVPSTTSRSTNNFSGQIQLGNNTMQQALSTHVSSPFFTVSGDTHQELHSFSLIPEQYVNNNHHNESYNLNFSISSTSSSGFNRGTLQSNSSTLPQIRRFTSTDNNGSSPSGFFLGAAPPPHAAVGSHQQQHHFQPTAFDAGLQLFYGDGSSHADHKGKGKS